MFPCHDGQKTRRIPIELGLGLLAAGTQALDWPVVVATRERVFLLLRGRRCVADRLVCEAFVVPFSVVCSVLFCFVLSSPIVEAAARPAMLDEARGLCLATAPFSLHVRFSAPHSPQSASALREHLDRTRSHAISALP